MAIRLFAAVGAVVACVLGTEPVALAAPAAPLPAAGSGIGPCATDPVPTHASLVPKTLEVSIPYPVVTADPGAPPSAPLRRTTMALPPNPCTDPCPDLTDTPAPPPDLQQRLGLPDVLLRPQPFYFALPPGPSPHTGPPPPAREHPPTESAPQSPERAAPRIDQVSEVAKETGADSINRTDKRWQVYGTDLGISWESGPGEVATAFGDTVGVGFHPPGGMGPDWRSNVLAFSSNHDLSHGIVFDRMVTDDRCHAAEVLSSRKKDNIEITTIPTSGFSLDQPAGSPVRQRQYMSYMSIRTWNSVPGTFFTNYGGIAYSDDHGQTWIKDPYAHWDDIFGLANFQVAAMVPQGGYVYMFGTPNTRLGSVGLARVPAAQVLNTSAYQYWHDGTWTPVGGSASATPIVEGPAGELSVRYDTARGVWQMSYLDTAKAAIVLREANSPQGLWSKGTPTVTVAQYPELYGGFIHPWSTGSDLYFTISTWSDYNVYLMHAKLND